MPFLGRVLWKIEEILASPENIKDPTGYRPALRKDGASEPHTRVQQHSKASLASLECKGSTGALLTVSGMEPLIVA